MPMLSISLLNSLGDKALIEYALAHNCNFALLKLPGQDAARVYVSERILEGGDTDGIAGYVVSPFRNNRVRLIPADYIRDWHCRPEAKVSRPGGAYSSVAPDWYKHGVETLARRQALRKGKTVFAVNRKAVCGIDLADAFSLLAETYSDAFVFCWKFADEPEAWLGATPELLMERKDGRLHTMALAGTRKIEPAGTPWDDKNVEEQKMVSDFIHSVFSSMGLACQSSSVQTLRAGEIEHICTRFIAEIPEHGKMCELLGKLAPTPAVSGFPRSESLADIAELEPFDRNYYSGYSGIRSASGEEVLFVTLRCLSMHPHSGDCTLYAGGGITALSEPESEWREVCAKMNTLSAVLGLTPQSLSENAQRIETDLNII